MLNFMSLFQLAIGGYLLWCAFTGKGSIYDDANVKEGLKEKYYKTIRIFSFIIGGLMLPGAVADLLQSPEAPNPVLTTIGVVFWALSFAALIVLVVLVVRMGDRKKKKAAGAAKPGVSRAAFEFDEEEQKPKQ